MIPFNALRSAIPTERNHEATGCSSGATPMTMA